MNESFREILLLTRGKTLVDNHKMYNIWQCCSGRKKSKGDVIEIGVYMGGTALMLGKSLPEKHLYLFDTFAGLPEDKIEQYELSDDLHGGRFNYGVDKVVNFLNKNGLSNFTCYAGTFPDSLSLCDNMNDKTFSIAHIDCDLYKSTYDSLSYIYPRLEIGGIIIVDDYKFPKCPGVEKSINEYFKDKKDFPLDMGSYQAIIFKS